MSYVLGVDLGTTYTGVAVGRGEHVEMVALGDRNLVVPAIVFAGPDGSLVTGDAAVRRALDQPGRSAREFKRRLGDPTPLLLGGSPYSPAILMAAVLKAAVARVTEMNGEPPEQIVLTHPAVWGPYRREQFEQVPGLSGLADVTTITEPVAAATYYAATKQQRDDQLVAVYDLGGGTFDTTVVRLGRDGAQVLGDPEGIEWLGGIDFDEAVLHHVDQELDGAVSALDPDDPRSAALLVRLQAECTLAKEALSVEDQVTVRVVLPSGESAVRLTRETFEARIRPAVASTVDALQRVLTSAGVSASELSAILLVGGSSRIPLVAQMLKAAFDRPIAVDTHPKNAVALGAAMIASQRRAAAGTVAAPAPTSGRRLSRRLAAALVTVAAVVTVATLAALSVRGQPAADSLSTATTSPATSSPASVSVSSTPASPTTLAPRPRSVTLPPVNGQFDYQIGGAYPPSAATDIVVRDRSADPAPGKYNICYLNAFQTQTDDAAFWRENHDDLLLKSKDGKYFSDPDWPGEYLLDTSTTAKRTAIAEIVNEWTDDCGERGFQALDPDNQDSWTRSKGLLSRSDNVAMATLLTSHAHSIGLAVGQRNTPEFGRLGRTTIKFDFAIAEECQFYQECGVYLQTYGDNVIEIEYTDQARRAYEVACKNQGQDISVALRDRDVTPKGQPGYLAETC